MGCGLVYTSFVVDHSACYVDSNLVFFSELSSWKTTSQKCALMWQLLLFSFSLCLLPLRVRLLYQLATVLFPYFIFYFF